MRQLPKLTPTQEKILSKMLPDMWKSAYSLGASLSTMYALEKKGYVISRGQGALGSFYSPQTVIQWKKYTL